MRTGTKGKEFTLDRNWLTIDLSPKEYAKLTGHSEGYFRRSPSEKVVIRIRIPTEEVMDSVHDIHEIRKE